MRVLVAWDDEEEAEEISMYLCAEDNKVTMTTTPANFQAALESGMSVDILFMTTELPDAETSFKLFELARVRYPDVPVVGACRPSDVYRVVRFMANGMSSYISRDVGGDYMFLLRAILESALKAGRAARDKELTRKLRQELESVRLLQAAVLPKGLDAPPGYRMSARYEPAEIRVVGGQPVAMAGGDYYDVFSLADGNLALLVGDAAGHGMKSCLSVMTLHTLVRMMRRQEFSDSAQFVQEINRGLCDQTLVTEKGGFITLVYAILNPNTRMLQWSAAGHHPPLLQNLSTGIIEPLADRQAGGLPLAVDEDAEYETYICQLPNEFRLLLYTDGLEEAYPEHDDSHHFGVEGIIQTLAETSESSPEESLTKLLDACERFTQGSGRQDDTSLLMLERRV